MDALKDLLERIGTVKDFLLVFAPARLDFLNTHQDYKGLPIVSVAVNRRVYIALLRDKQEVFCFEFLNLGDSHCYSKEKLRVFNGSFADYWSS